MENKKCVITKPKLSKGPRVYSKTPDMIYGVSDLPDVFDWRNINTTNYLSITKNQHIPIYCGSCWAHSTTSALSDRFNILIGNKGLQVSLSPQVILNCHPGGGSCHGGNPLDVYEHIYKNGLPDDSCQQYVAEDPEVAHCSDKQLCEDCPVPAPKTDEDGKKNCFARFNYKSYFVKEYGSVRGAEKMKFELLRGPIDCVIESTSRFHDYKGGIYEEEKSHISINHAVSVVGWGKENDIEYWVMRNSWGTYWGEHGFARLRMHVNNLGIESDCNFAIPSFEKSEFVPQ